MFYLFNDYNQLGAKYIYIKVAIMNTRGLGKNRAFIHKKLQQMMGKDFNPVIEMVKQAVKLDELAEEEPSIINCEKSIHSWSRVAEYLTPKLRSQEIKMEDELVVSINKKSFDGSDNEKDN